MAARLHLLELTVTLLVGLNSIGSLSSSMSCRGLVHAKMLTVIRVSSIAGCWLQFLVFGVGPPDEGHSH